MGNKMGVPSLKLNNAGTKSKRCGSFAGVAYEAFEERKGKDQDINHELSKNNIYIGMRSAEELLEYSRQHVAQLRDAKGRALRSDAVVICATVFKPPAVYMRSLTDEEGDRMMMDCLEFFKKVVGEDNIKSFMIHKDELGKHAHCFWEPMTIDGRLCAKEAHGLKFFKCINEHLPAFLRERGWDIEDADCYDRAQKEMEQEKENRRKKNGRSSAQYKRDAEAEKQKLLEENDALIEKNEQLKKDNEMLEVERDGLMADVSALLTIQNDDEMDAAVEEINLVFNQIENHLQEQDAIVDELEEASRESMDRGELVWRVQDAVFMLRKVAETIRSLIKRAKDMLVGIIRYGAFFKREDVKPIAASLKQRLENAAARAQGRAKPEHIKANDILHR